MSVGVVYRGLMVTGFASELVRQEAELPQGAELSAVLSAADTVEAFAISDDSFPTEIAEGLLVRYANRVTDQAVTDVSLARLVLRSARLGVEAKRVAARAEVAYADVREAARELVEAGWSESEAARVCDVDRMTVRKALGKRGGSKEPLETLF